MRKFVVYSICLSLASPVFAQDKGAPPPPGGSTTTPSSSTQTPKQEPPKGSTPPASNAKTPDPVKSPMTPTQYEAARKKIAGNKAAIEAYKKATDADKQAMIAHIHGGGKVADPAFQEIVKRANASQVASGSQTAHPVVPASVGAPAPPGEETVARQPRSRAQNDKYKDPEKYKTEATATCLDGNCPGTSTPAPPIPPQQVAVLEPLATPTPIRTQSSGGGFFSGGDFDWGSALIGGGVGFLGGMLISNFMNQNKNKHYGYGYGFGPGGQGMPWWQMQPMPPQYRMPQLPPAYPAPGGPMGGPMMGGPMMGGMMGGAMGPGGYPLPGMLPGYGFGYGGGAGYGYGYGYGGGFGYGAAPIARPYIYGNNMGGPTGGFQTPYTANIYNTPVGVSPALYGGNNYPLPSIVQGR